MLYPFFVLFSMVLFIRFGVVSQRIRKKEKICTCVKLGGPVEIFTDHLVDGICGSDVPGIFDNNAGKLARGKE